MPINLAHFEDGQYYDAAANRAYVPIYSGGGYSGADNYNPGQITGFRGYEWAPGRYSDPAQLNGTPYDILDFQGNKTGQGTWEGLSRTNMAAHIAMPFLAAAGMAGLQGLGVGANAGAAGGGMQTSAMGAGAGSSGTGLSMSGGGLGLTGSSGAGYSFAGPTVGMSAASPGAGAIGAGLGTGLAAGTGSMLGASALSGAGGAGGAGAAGGAAAGTASGASGLAGLLGPAATLAGALAGSQGQQTGGDTVRKMDPRLEEYVYGSLLPAVRAKAQADMSPERQAQWDKLRSSGLGLLSQAPAGNAFNTFYGGRR